jgi:hypothetical protein
MADTPTLTDLSADPATLRAFDMVIAISEDAINKQLDLLYNTPVTTLPLPQPGTQQPKQDYLISHAVSMHYPILGLDGKPKLNPDGTPKISKTGIDGWIAAPKIKINSRKNLSSTVILTFIKNPDPNATGNVDTTYTTYEGEGEDAELVTLNIDNWSVSWDADLSSADIQAIEESKSGCTCQLQRELLILVLELIALPNETIAQLKGFVDNRDYLVSSIFCLMDSVNIANTFKVIDATGNDHPAGNWEKDFILSISSWVQADAKTQGTPTPQNPFVLGYGVRQNIPPAPGIPLFVPRYFQFSTSATSTADGEAPTTSALNFCIKTKEQVPINMQKDGNAGNYYPSLVSQMSILPGESDGVMAISNGLIYDQFILPYFVTTFHVVDFYSHVLTTCERVDKQGDFIETNPALGHYRSFKSYIGRIGPHDTSRNGMLDQEKTTWLGWENFEVILSSDPIPPAQHDLNIQRRAFILVRMQHMVQVELETSPRLTSNWSDASNAYAWINLKFHFTLHAKDDGGWTIVLDKDQSSLPTVNNGVIQKIGNAPSLWPDMKHSNPGTIETYDAGVYSWGDREGFFSISGNTGLDQNLGLIKGWTDPDVEKIAASLQSVLSQLNTRIMMPAGNVFSFKGMNFDGQGNLYGGITYDSLTAGEKFVPKPV